MDETLKLISKNRKRETIPNPSTYNTGIRDGWIPFWAKNARRNARHIEDRFAAEDPPPDVGKMEKVTDRDCIIIGSGPTLDDNMSHIGAWQGDIFCSSSHLAILEANMITPTYCVIIDADPAMTYLVSRCRTDNITLITHPCMETEVLKAWDGPIKFFKMQDPGDPFFSEYLPMMYQDLNDKHETIEMYVMNSGCVANTCIAIAEYLGYQRMYLIGVDMGFPGDRYRFTDVTKDQYGIGWEEVPVPRIPEERKTFLATGDVWTDTVSVFYKYSLFVLWGLDKPDIYRVGNGILRELPEVQMVNVVRGIRPDPLDPDQKYLRAQKYLRYRGIYICQRKRVGRTFKHSMRTFRRLRKWITVWTMHMERKKQPPSKEVERAVKHSSGEYLNKLREEHGGKAVAKELKAGVKRWRKQQLVPVRRSLLKSNRIRLKVAGISAVVEHSQTWVGWEGFVRVQNLFAMPWYKRPWFLVKWWTGKIWGRW